LRKHAVKGVIYALDNIQMEYPVCYIEQITYENEAYEYIFRPYYDIIKLCEPSFFQGIPGLNLNLKKEVYIRENRTPTFIYERTPQENREDLWQLLEEVQMDYLDKLEWLIRTDKVYTGDRLIVKRYMEPTTKKTFEQLFYGDKIIVDSIDAFGKTYFEKLKNLLTIIISGACLESKEIAIHSNNREDLFKLVKYFYNIEYFRRREKQRLGIEQAKINNKYRGRKKIKVSTPKLKEVREQMLRKEITSKEAVEILGLNSVSTLYRRLKELKEKEKSGGSRGDEKSNKTSP
jgi:hypothetical protein